MKVYQEVQVDKDPISTKHMVYSDEIFRLYKSYAASDIKEQKIAQRTNILRHPILLVIPVMIAFTIYMFCKSSLVHGDMWGTKKLQAASAAKAQAASVEPPRKDGYFLNGKWVSTAVPATKTPGAAVSDKAEETKKPDGPKENVAKEGERRKRLFCGTSGKVGSRLFCGQWGKAVCVPEARDGRTLEGAGYVL